MKSQWDCLRQNLGEWQGSFTQLSPDGQEVSDTPSVLVLSENADQQTIRLVLTRSPVDGPVHEIVRSFSYPGPGSTVPFFETGSFSQGSLQWAPLGQFGAELALTHQHRRLRLVPLFEGTAEGKSRLKTVTLIREVRAGCADPPSPPLTVDALVGRWQGKAIALSPSGADAVVMATDLTIAVNGQTLTQTLVFGTGSETRTVESCGRIEGSRVWFDQGPMSYRVLLLPGGGSMVSPMVIERNHSFLLEAGWLVTPTYRQRLVRQYNERGEWIRLTLVEEHRQ